MKHTHLLTIACLALPLTHVNLLQPAQAQNVPDQVAQVTILEGWRLPSGAHMAAVKVTLAPGWHTYWRAPGAAGIPPRFDWSGSSAHSGIKFHWPVPDVYEQNGMKFLGYENELILPFEILPNQAGDVQIKGQIEMGVCEDICLPFEASFEATLPAQANTPSPAIQAALNHKPKRINGARCSATALEDGMQIKAQMQVPALGGLEMAVLEHPDPTVWVSAPITHRSGKTMTLESELVPSNAVPFFVDRSELILTVVGNGTAYEARGCTGG